MVSCTDFSEDIQNLDDKVNNLGNATQTELASLQQAITDLEAKLSAQYATKDEVAALKTTLENSIASEVAALSEDIAEVSAALKTAKGEINEAIAGLDSKKADKAEVEAAVKTATEAIAALQAELESAKEDLEAEIASVKDEIAAAQEELNSKINGVDAKANELQNTLLSLSDYLATLEAKVNEINNTLLSLGEYLPTIEAKILEVKNTVESLGAEYEANKDVVDAKLNELHNTLLSLSEHLEEYEATTDFKLVELQGSLAALSTYLEEYEASVDAKFNEILNTIASLSIFLDEKFAALEATDTDLYMEIDGLREAFTTINNLLADEVAAREAEDAAIYELLYSSVTALNNLIADLQAEDEALYVEIENVRTYVAQVYNALSTEIAAANAALQAHIAAFEAYKEVVDAKLAGLEAEDGAIYELIGSSVTALNNHIADLQAKDEEIYAEIESVRTNLGQAINFLQSEDAALKAEFDEKVDAIYAEIEGVRANVAQVYTLLNDMLSDLAGDVAANTEAIKKLFERVQSLVYVPDYSDHKATIDWAMIVSNQIMPAAAEDDVNYTIVTKATDLKYLVKANAGEDAATAAAEIAANPSVLDYFVTDVKTRGASQTGADLEIVKVKAEGEYIIVSVVAKKFDAKFFENKRQGIYSAALALVDAKGNNLTSEYTNLVPGEAAHIEMGLYLAEGDDVNNVAGTEDTTKMPCNDSETVYTSLCPTIGFLIDDEKAMANLTSIQPYLTVEDLKALGYDMDVKYRLDLDKAISSSIPSNMVSSGNIFNKYFKVGNDRQANVNVSVVEGTPFSAKGQSIYAKYTATANGTTVTYTHYFVLSNAQVAVDMETSAEWTIALQDALYDGKNHYAHDYILKNVPFKAVGGPVAHLKPVLNSPAVSEAGYPKFYVKDADGEWVEVEDRSFKLAAFNDNATVDIEMIGGTYSWNNSYKIVWSTVNDDENVDYTTTAIVNLVGRPDEINVTIPVDFKLLGTNTWFEAPADLLGESFKALDKYLEYGDSAADLAKWTSVFNSFVTRYNNVELPMPVVNGETSKWIANLDQLATAKLFIGKNKIYEDQPNVITWSVKPWWGVPVNFTITGDVTVPATAENFIYSQDYVKDVNTRPYAEVFGKIDEVEGDEVASKKYSIIKSDLAKYFNLDIESLEGHNYTVDFEVTLPDADSEIGNVKVLPNTTTPVVTDKGAATYYYFLEDQAVLHWDTYRGLEVIVNATLKVNGYTVDSKKLSLITKDPLTLTGADFSVTRQLRDNTVIPVYQKLVLTSSVETSYKNLLSKKMDKGTGVYDTLAEAEAYANGVYGADIEVVLGPKGVYYYDNTGKLIILGTNKYGYDEQTGVLTIYGDDANVKNYYADFTAVMSSVICGGEHKVPFRVTATVAK